MFFISGEYVTGRDADFVESNADCGVIFFFIDSKIFWWTLAALIGSFFFSGRMSRVHLVVNRLFSIVAVVACSMRRL